MFEYIKNLMLWALAMPTLIWCATYFLPLLLVSFRPTPNLKKKYGATWALVTGGSSGIGLALTKRLAQMGLNVVVVAIDDDILKNSIVSLKKEYPEIEFRSIGASFSPGGDYLEKIIEATKDIDVQVIMNNAGYIVTSFYHLSTMQAQMNNLECNLTAPTKITLHFLKKMLAKKQKGCFVYTSSIAGFIPNPFAVMYGTTKAGLSQFAASLAPEVMCKGIDVTVVHPSPVASNFYNNLAKIDALEMAKNMAVSADSLPDTIFQSIGWFVLRDLGNMGMMVRSGVACASYNFLAVLFAKGAPFMDDYKRNDK
mmetsp:Transcript_157/g.196  ORF Transcript_157/g.196 Transcript_157/m.196 type:complete len:311 (-) Transcript_157:212-1144(-)